MLELLRRGCCSNLWYKLPLKTVEIPICCASRIRTWSWTDLIDEHLMLGSLTVIKLHVMKNWIKLHVKTISRHACCVVYFSISRSRAWPGSRSRSQSRLQTRLQSHSWFIVTVTLSVTVTVTVTVALMIHSHGHGHSHGYSHDYSRTHDS